MLESSAEIHKKTTTIREQMGKSLLRFGVSYLDDAFGPIQRNDLVIAGAPTGAGKTHLVSRIALANLEDGKRVAFVALEAFYGEIQLRMEWEHLCGLFYADKNRPQLRFGFSYRNWISGLLGPAIKPYEEESRAYCETAYRDLLMFYKRNKFTVTSLIEAMSWAKQSADALIVDHVHYFDLEDDNDNRAIREIVMTARDLVLENDLPIILVSHLRKKDRGQKELCPGPDEFHGTSDIVKVASKAFTIAPGGITEDGERAITYMRTVKSRVDGSCTKFIGKTFFNYRGGNYAKEYELGWAGTERWCGVTGRQIPDWARQSGNLRTDDSVFAGQCADSQNQGGQRTLPSLLPWYQRDEVGGDPVSESKS